MELVYQMEKENATEIAMDDTDIRYPEIAIADARCRLTLAKPQIHSNKQSQRIKTLSIGSRATAMSFVTPGILLLGLADGSVRSVYTRSQDDRQTKLHRAKPSAHRAPVHSIRPMQLPGCALSISSDAVVLWRIAQPLTSAATSSLTAPVLQHPCVVPSGNADALDCQRFHNKLVLLYKSGELMLVAIKSLAVLQILQVALDHAAVSLAVLQSCAAVLDSLGNVHIVQLAHDQCEHAHSLQLPESQGPARQIVSLQNDSFALTASSGTVLCIRASGEQDGQFIPGNLHLHVAMSLHRLFSCCICADGAVRVYACSSQSQIARAAKPQRQVQQHNKMPGGESVSRCAKRARETYAEQSNGCIDPAKLRNILLAYERFPEQYRARFLTHLLGASSIQAGLAEQYVHHNSKNTKSVVNGLRLWTHGCEEAIECVRPVAACIAPHEGSQRAFLACVSFLLSIQCLFRSSNSCEVPRAHVEEVIALVQLEDVAWSEELLQRYARPVSQLFLSFMIPLFHGRQSLIDHALAFGPLFWKCIIASLLLRNKPWLASAFEHCSASKIVKQFARGSESPVLKDAHRLRSLAQQSGSTRCFPSLKVQEEYPPTVTQSKGQLHVFTLKNSKPTFADVNAELREIARSV